jgi:hypothetical protein
MMAGRFDMAEHYQQDNSHYKEIGCSQTHHQAQTVSENHFQGLAAYTLRPPKKIELFGNF